MIYIGIDPGDSGGIAIYNNPNLLLLKMPETAQDLLKLLNKFSNKDCIACVEKLHGMPGMGGTSMFKFGKNNGYIEMALLATGIRTEYVSPQRWQKHFRVGTKGQCNSASEWKNKLKAKAQQLYPKHNIFLWGADALLIMDYGRVTFR